LGSIADDRRWAVAIGMAMAMKQLKGREREEQAE
jgi:hypothetical protein